MRCGAGCASCCTVELTVLAIEADPIGGYVRGLGDAARTALAARAEARPDALSPRCAALDDDHRCAIYPVRPLVCRSHGVPIRTGDLVDACSLNFHKRTPSTVPPADVLVQDTMSTVLLALDAARAAAVDVPAGTRVALRALLAGAAGG